MYLTFQTLYTSQCGISKVLEVAIHQLTECQPENRVPTWFSSNPTQLEVIYWSRLVKMYSSGQLAKPSSICEIKSIVYISFTMKSSYRVLQWIDLESTNKQGIVRLKDVYFTLSSVTSRPLHTPGTYPLYPCPLYHSFLHIDNSFLGFLSNNASFISLCEFI